MTSHKNIVLGVTLLAIVAGAIIIILEWVEPPPAPLTQVHVYGGYRFTDPAILAYLEQEYRLAPTFQRIGTSDMIRTWTEEIDCIFPASRNAVAQFEQERPGVIRDSATIFQDPITIFMWQEYLAALEEAGIVFTRDGVHFLDMSALLEATAESAEWQTVGIDRPGYVTVEFTEPLSSNSGMMWMSLLASYRIPGNETGGQVVTLNDLNQHDDILLFLQSYWESQGTQVDTTGKMFTERLIGRHTPMIVAYESSFTDWYRSASPEQQARAQEIIGVYPEVTIISEHVLASTGEDCTPLFQAFSGDPRLQELAWEFAGVRNSAGGIGEPPGHAPWVAPNVAYMPEPRESATDAIKACLNDSTLCESDRE